MNNHIPFFYAAVTPEAVGIFTSWDNAKKLVHGRRNKHKKFVRYYDALEYIKANLGVKDRTEFGLDDHKPAFDRIITRNRS